jgi:RNA polymerase sigma-54 factor
MKQSLQLRIGQQLTMTPQLQQAIRLLQLSTLDLQAEVQEIVESNPMLEQAEGDESASADSETDWESSDPQETYEVPAESDRDNFKDGEQKSQASERGNDNDTGQSDGDNSLADIPTDLPVDSNWDDIYDVPVTSSSYSEQDNSVFENYGGTTAETLQDHLQWQLQMTPFSETDLAIAETLIDSIDEDGYLTTPLEALLEGLPPELEADLEEVEMVLRRIQAFDPVGVAARDLRECLLLQLQQFDPDIPHLNEATRLVTDYLDLLGGRDYTQIMRRMKLSKEELQEVILLIQTLNPRPGGAVTQSRAEYVIPDVVVRKENGVWRVDLNPEAVPRLRINTGYANLIKRADNSSENTFLKNNLQEARWFIKSLQSRNETLLKVARCIVERQQAFLEHGDEAMKALVLHDVAEAVGMHESTISRVTTQKYMHTPRGIFELKYFFSSHVSTATGGACSATAIRALIKKLIAAENVQKPLSDSKIATILSDQGINVARRTVAKYREAMSIPPSNERKRLA